MQTSKSSSSASQAELLKIEGNQLFARDKLGPAIDRYTEAIALCSNVPVYYTNRALCFRKKKDWPRVESDCRKALEFDKKSVKAHFMLGLALQEHNLLSEAINELQKALELARGLDSPRAIDTEEIWQELAHAKYTQWLAEATARRERQRLLREHLQKSMRREYEQACQALLTNAALPPNGRQPQAAPDSPEAAAHMDQERDWGHGGGRSGADPGPPGGSGAAVPGTWGTVPADCEQSLRGDESRGGAEGPSASRGGDELVDSWRAAAMAQLEQEYVERVNTLENVFDRAHTADRPAEIPEHLCCNITMDIFRDPVVTPSGVSYERSVLLEHLKRGRHFDPVSRQPLELEQVVPNLALREAVQEFLDAHGWAYRTNRHP